MDWGNGEWRKRSLDLSVFSSLLAVSILGFACVSDLYNHEYETIHYPDIATEMRF